MFYFGMENWPGYTDSDEKSLMYFPHKTQYNNCLGYWLASPSASNYKNVLGISSSGNIAYNDYIIVFYAIRPIVTLKPDIFGEKADGVWNLEN